MWPRLHGCLWGMETYLPVVIGLRRWHCKLPDGLDDFRDLFIVNAKARVQFCELIAEGLLVRNHLSKRNERPNDD